MSGDSGGPLIIPDAPDRSISSGSSKFDTLVALTSFGVEPCRGGGSPGGYTLVGPFRDWIDSVIASIGESEPSVRKNRPTCFAGRMLCRSSYGASRLLALDLFIFL